MDPSLQPATYPDVTTANESPRWKPFLVLDIIENFIYRSRPSRFIAALLAVSFLKTGIWYMPNLDEWRAIAINPFHNPFTESYSHYLFWSWLSPFAAWVLKLQDQRPFLYFHLLFSLAFTCTFIGLIWTQFEERDARTALVLFLAIPVSATAYFWVGMDSVTLFLMALLFVARRHLWLVLPIGVLLGMQHFEQASIAYGALLLALFLSFVLKAGSDYSIRWGLASLLGVVLGKIVLFLIFTHFGVAVNSGRTFLLHWYRMYVGFFYYHFQYVLWSVFGAGWIAVAKYAERGKAALPFLVALCGLLLLLPLVADETRVIAIVSFPLVAAYLLLNPGFLRALDGRLVSAIFGIWLIVPWPWAWLGKPMVSIFPYNVACLLHWLFGWLQVPTNQPLWPFQS
ncbi:MAG TPA: hypothetical protein VLV47_01515 [Candidatus Bathyarchaeia archaeon]|nr:hypothetical protein [Candidatus Bathyarchaeia archaeon]